MDNINQKFNKMKTGKMISKDTQKYLIIIIFKSTRFYRNIQDPNRKKDLLSLIKLCVKLAICPIEILLNIINIFER